MNTELVNELVVEVYLPSTLEYHKYSKKFMAFIVAEISKKAKRQGAFGNKDYNNNGYYFFRSAHTGTSHSTINVAYGSSTGTYEWYDCDNSRAGIRPMFQLIYNPESRVVKSFREIYKTTSIWDSRGMKKEITGKAPIVIFGGKEYVWLNKEECENGIETAMVCWSLELPERAVPFDKSRTHNDFAKAKELRVQAERIVKENCTKEELLMLVAVRMTKTDNYEKVEPVLKNVIK